jgi:hypothetical protein
MSGTFHVLEWVRIFAGRGGIALIYYSADSSLGATDPRPM